MELPVVILMLMEEPWLDMPPKALLPPEPEGPYDAKVPCERNPPPPPPCCGVLLSSCMPWANLQLLPHSHDPLALKDAQRADLYLGSAA